MIKNLFLFIGLSASFIGSPATYAAIPVPAPPKVSAPVHYVIDASSGFVLAENNADEKRAPASLTKIMTTYVVAAELAAGNISMEDEVVISTRARKMGGSRSFIEQGQKVPVRELLMGTIVQSGNDASVALAEHVAGSEDVFAELMNQYGKSMGLTSSNFVNATGLPDPDHYTTARDLSIISKALIHDFPAIYELFSVKEYTYGDITQQNRNKLLWSDESVDGIKTGYTEAAGYCLATSAKRNGMRLISIVLGADSGSERSIISESLLTYGFRFYETHKLYSANEPVTTVRVWEGNIKELELGPGADLYITIPRGQYKELKASMELEEPVIAPVEQGKAKGQVKLSLIGRELHTEPLLALESVPQGGFLDRMMDKARLLFE